MRADKPIGTALLLWPTLSSFFILTNGNPDLFLILLFVLGTFLMRSAGCVINDYFDRNLDGSVARTKNRPCAIKKAKESGIGMVVAKGANHYSIAGHWALMGQVQFINLVIYPLVFVQLI